MNKTTYSNFLEYREISKAINELEKRKEELRALLVPELEDGALVSEEGEILLQMTETKKMKFEAEAFAARHRELYEEWCVPVVTQRLLIKSKEKK